MLGAHAFENLANSGGAEVVSLVGVVQLFVHSLLMGVILSVVGYINLTVAQGTPRSIDQKIEFIRGASSILFLCVGMTGIIILVDNNLARAFAIGAALSLVRFRAKIGKSNTTTQLLFGVLVGIACGLHNLEVAWISMLTYCLIQFVLLAMILKMKGKQKQV